jgi:hypothetical protein
MVRAFTVGACVAFMAFLVACGPAVTPSSGGAPVEAIDHVYVPASSARELAALLRDELQLPEVWPFAERQGGASVGISLGNLVLELLERPGADGSAIEGIALWPQQRTEDVRAQLSLAGLGVGRSVRMTNNAAGWVLTGLADFPEGNVFLCEYLEAETVRTTRARGAAELEAAGGGTLGLRGVREVVVMSRDPARQRDRWRTLATIASDSVASATREGVSELQAFDSGPAIRVVPGARDAIAGLVLAVRDVEAARAAWPQALGALPITFVAEAATPPRGR